MSGSRNPDETSQSKFQLRRKAAISLPLQACDPKQGGRHRGFLTRGFVQVRSGLLAVPTGTVESRDRSAACIEKWGQVLLSEIGKLRSREAGFALVTDRPWNPGCWSFLQKCPPYQGQLMGHGLPPSRTSTSPFPLPSLESKWWWEKSWEPFVSLPDMCAPLPSLHLPSFWNSETEAGRPHEVKRWGLVFATHDHFYYGDIRALD